MYILHLNFNDLKLQCTLTCVYIHTYIHTYIQCCEKVFAPLLFFCCCCWAYLSHTRDSDHHLILILLQDNPEYKMQFWWFQWWFHLYGTKSCPNLPGTTWKSNCPLNLITTLCSNNVCSNWQGVFHIAVEEFWPTLLCRIDLIQPHWMVFKNEWTV